MNKFKMLRVNLSTGEIDRMPLPEDLERDYMGGEGLGTRLLWDMVPPKADPLGHHNAIIFASAPLNGTAFPAGPRGTVVFKSPETGTVSMSNMGGHWGARLRMAGYALIAVTGRAQRPVYIIIDGDQVEVRDAGHLWGKDIPQLQTALEAATAERGASVVRPWAFPMDMGVLFSDVTGLTEKPDPAAEKGIAKWYKPYKEFTVASNCIGVCLYPALFNIPDVHQTLEGYSAVTGRKIDLKEYLRIGERTICIQRAFNARDGFDRKGDTLPRRILEEPIKGGKYDGRRINDLDGMLDEYYEASGFDKATGWPTREKLEGLGLKDVADELYLEE